MRAPAPGPGPQASEPQGAGSGLRATGSPLAALKNQALRYLSQREHSRAELRRKLQRYLAGRRRRSLLRAQIAAQNTGALNVGPVDDDAEVSAASRQAEAEAIEAVLDRLIQTELLSDERAAAALVRTKGARFGQRHLKLQLQAKGLEPELVAQALQAVGGSEHERAWALWQRRFGQAPASDKDRARQTRFLLARGFTGETVARVVRQALAEAG